jgi:hypothetical protein
MGFSAIPHTQFQQVLAVDPGNDLEAAVDVEVDSGACYWNSLVVRCQNAMINIYIYTVYIYVCVC